MLEQSYFQINNLNSDSSIYFVKFLGKLIEYDKHFANRVLLCQP